MGKKLGHMIHELREKQGRTIEDAARGLLSEAELSRVENGTKETEYLILEALFETYGKSLDKLEIVVSIEEYGLLNLRDKIYETLLGRKLDETKNLLELYMTKADKEKLIHRQYAEMINAILFYEKTKELSKTYERLRNALHITTGSIKEENLHLYHQEIYLVYMMLWIQYRNGQKIEAMQTIRKMEQYINEFYIDEEEKVKIYPQCTWLLGKVLLDEHCYKAAYLVIEKGISCLVENGAMHWLMQLLELKQECAEHLGEEKVVADCRHYLEAIKTLYEIAEADLPADISPILFMQSSTQRECIISNYFLKNLREEKGFTQYEVSEDICAWETVSRIESGRTPNQKKLYRLWKKLGIERERYYGLVESEDYEVYEMVRNYKRAVGKEQLEISNKLYDEIKNRLDINIDVNRQFIEQKSIMDMVFRKEISNQQAIERLYNLLDITMPPLENGKKIYRTPFRTEFDIINKIAMLSKEIGEIEQAIKLYAETLKQYCKNEKTMQMHVVQGLVLYVNYAAYLEDNDEIDLAEKTAKEGIQFALKCCRGDTAYTVLANFHCIGEKKKQYELVIQYLKNAYHLSVLYKDEPLAMLLNSIYKSKTSQDID